MELCQCGCERTLSTLLALTQRLPKGQLNANAKAFFFEHDGFNVCGWCDADSLVTERASESQSRSRDIRTRKNYGSGDISPFAVISAFVVSSKGTVAE